MLEIHGHNVFPYSIDDIRNIYKEQHFPRGIDLDNPSYLDVVHFLYSKNTRSKLSEFIKVQQVDIAHLHIYHGQLSTSILAPLRRAGIPIVQTLHDFKLVCSNNILMSGKSNSCHAVLPSLVPIDTAGTEVC